MTEPNPWAAPSPGASPGGAPDPWAAPPPVPRPGQWGAPPPQWGAPPPPQWGAPQPPPQWGAPQPPPNQWGAPQQPWGGPGPVMPVWELPAAMAYWGPPPKPPRRGLDRTVFALLMAVVVLLVSGIATAATRTAQQDEQRLARLRAQLEQELPGLKAFVERERGLKFLREVDVELLEDDDFVDRLFTDTDSTSAEQPETPADVGATLYVLKLLDDREGLDDAVDDAYVETIQGFYDFETKELVIRGRGLNPLTRLVLVHELTHAVQDQHFDLAKMDFDGRTDESELGWTSLVEGDANRVDEAYRESLPEVEQRELEQLEQEQFDDIGDAAPDVVYALLAFPYAIGPDFVRAVLDESGQPALDRAFRTPPTSSEHILEPATFLGGDAPVQVAKPGVDGEVVDEGALGQLGIGLALGTGDTDEVRSVAARGWSGDHYVTYEKGDEVCLRADVVMETPRDRDELAASLRRFWPNGVTNRGEIGLRFDACR